MAPIQPSPVLWVPQIISGTGRRSIEIDAKLYIYKFRHPQNPSDCGGAIEFFEILLWLEYEVFTLTPCRTAFHVVSTL